ncbi:helix-turn-helix transcriptional regulator [Asanoa ishikariensis]|uniref:LuxR family transcriptional regulator, maltose regulon positive regulatory protein n=1 Tax=Asanoa ishikariensis TaxID=137265 RepID=A0A1H3SZE1_9ACTN|nr:LuxR C-terminal-related transcriptional regulator [Asanoa ishikariensis]GIF63212.1 helix-turn-helix transcriptional regulator [Asanoa ishikariensis]SDZ43362.1 LuxR family transcriptional regulator, maltose regulon positive regulatory protein [Asanoa ishikariensis]
MVVLATKLFAPARRARLVARPRVTQRLDATLDAGNRLTLVSAPAGFGKTTVLGDWLAGLEQQVGWLSLDDGDNDPARFLAHLLAALARAGLDVDAAITDLTSLVNDIVRAGAEQGARWIVVLDDYHCIVAAEVHESVTFLLDHLPHQVRLVIATRADPPLPLARLRSRGQLTEVRAADLRFTPAEAGEFLNRVMALDLTAGDVAALEDRTEGWAAGLQLAALSLRGVADRAEVAGFIAAFTGSNRFVIDYLADEVLARQPPEVRDFLLRTAVLDRLTGPLCDAVTGGTDGTRTLADLERDNLFVVPLDNDRSWYRYHHLFADVLRARLLAESPEPPARLHERASAWFAAHGLVADAVRHALAAADFARAAVLIEQALPELRRARQDTLLMTWIRSLPEPMIRRSPVLSIVSGWSRLMARDLDGLTSRLDDAESALAAGARDPDLATTWADTEDLRTAPATIAVYRAALAQAHGDVDGTVREARHALSLAGPDDHFVRGAGGGFLGLAAWAAGNVQEALSTFAAAVRSLHAAGNVVDELDSTVVLADMWIAAGRPGQARRLLEEALRTAVAGGPPYPRATADLHVGLADLDRELDDLASAEAHLESARALAEKASITENQHRWYVVMAQVRAAAGDYDEAALLLDQAAALYRRGFYPDLRPIAALKARIQIAGGSLGAEGWAAQVTLDDEPDYAREYEHLTLARLLLFRRSSIPAVLALLDRLHAAAVAARRDGSVREIRVLQALAHQAGGDLPEALAALERSFDTPEPAGQVRLYLDEGAPMAALLGRGGELARALLSRRTTVVEPGLLSHRELQVLRLLDSGLTGPQIARELFVTVNTLRTHTKRIFTKLDVTTRAAAVRRARDRGLL